jgi:RNA polymerase sigma-70 factor (ECF subfamily)
VAELDDARLVALVRVGDRAALDALYRRHAPYVLSLSVRIQGHVTDVEDIVHDAFLRALARLGELRKDDAFRPWLASVTANLVRTRLRRRRFLGALGLAGAEQVDLDALVGESAGPETRAELGEVYGALRLLPVDQRLAWVLRFVEGHKLEEVARILECSLATAKRRLALAQEAVLANTTQRGTP